MAKELPFFKFEPSCWAMGRIQKRSNLAQLAFINLCCMYWHKLGEVDVETAKLNFGEEEISELLKYKIVHLDGSNLNIKFLDEQLDDVESFSKIQSIRGKISAAKRNQRSTGVEENSTTVAKNPTTVEPPLQKTQPIRREEIREDKKRKEESKKTHKYLFENSYTQIDNVKKVLIKKGQRHEDKHVLQLLEEFDPTFYITFPSGDFKKYCFRFLDFINDYQFKADTFETPQHSELW